MFIVSAERRLWICRSILTSFKKSFLAAFNAGESFSLVRRFASEAARHLNGQSVVMIVFSEDSGYESIIDIFLEAGLVVLSTTMHSVFFERYFAVSFIAAVRD